MEAIISYVNEHIEEFKAGVSSRYIEQNMKIDNLTSFGIKKKLNNICDVVRKRVKGERTRIYTLKKEYLESSYKAAATQTDI